MLSLIRTKINFKFLFALILIGLFTGISSSVFLQSLDVITQIREKYLFLIFFLPIGGFFSTYIYEKFGGNSSSGSYLIIEEIHNPKERIPLRMAPFVFLGTWITHLFGGSAGREGAAVQIGGAFAEKVAELMKFSGIQRKNLRRRLLIGGISAGFGSALGAPWAGMLFGSEVIHGGKIESSTLLESGMASWIAYFVTILLKSPHSHYSEFVNNQNLLDLLVLSLFSGIIFGAVAFTFSQSMHLMESMYKKIKLNASIKTFLGGSIIVILYLIIGNFKFAGLGLDSIQNAFSSPAHFSDIIGKIIFTDLTIASGFKGGEFVPLLYIGSHTGSYLGSFFPHNILLLTALGCCAVFAGASNTPFTSTVMACELFGWSILPFALVACLVSYFLSGFQGVYKSQNIGFKKNLLNKFKRKTKA